MKSQGKWRAVIADAAMVEMSLVTCFSPFGFKEDIGRDQYWYVRLGNLLLHHDGEWKHVDGHSETSKQRMAYAHKSAMSALGSLRKAVAPDEPACAAEIESKHCEW